MIFSYNDIDMYYEKYGSNKTSVIILPGWGDTRKTFDFLINFLKNYFTVYIFDYPGFGNSSFPRKDLNIFNYADFIHEFISQNEINDPILIGHSFGGRIITLLSGYYKYDFSNIIYIDSAGIRHQKYFSELLYKFKRKFGLILPSRLRNKYFDYLFNKYSSNDYKALSYNMRNTFKNIVNFDLKPFIKFVTGKVLILWGERDSITPVSDAYYMNNNILDSELITFKEYEHFPYLENITLFNNIIYEEIKHRI